MSPRPPSPHAWGVFEHAEWVSGHVILSNTGYVVRSIENGRGVGVPYSRMEPIRTYVRQKPAQDCADRLNRQTNYGRNPRSK